MKITSRNLDLAWGFKVFTALGISVKDSKVFLYFNFFLERKQKTVEICVPFS